MTYNWQQDALECWRLAIHWQSIRHGHRRPQRPLEVYWCEQAGSIP
jgi:hypothetical protein